MSNVSLRDAIRGLPGSGWNLVSLLISQAEKEELAACVGMLEARAERLITPPAAWPSAGSSARDAAPAEALADVEAPNLSSHVIALALNMLRERLAFLSENSQRIEMGRNASNRWRPAVLMTREDQEAAEAYRSQFQKEIDSGENEGRGTIFRSEQFRRKFGI